MTLRFSYFLVELEAIGGIGANQTNENMHTKVVDGVKKSWEQTRDSHKIRPLVYKNIFIKQLNSASPKVAFDESSAKYFTSFHV